jgi:hypothetical protein
MSSDDPKKWLPVVIGVGGIILIGVGILISQNKKVEEPEFVVEKDSGRGQSDDGVKIIIVDVAGAVEKPGVYELPNNFHRAKN